MLLFAHVIDYSLMEERKKGFRIDFESWQLVTNRPGWFLLIYWDFLTHQLVGSMQNSTNVAKEVLLMSEVRGKWPDLIKIIEKHKWQLTITKACSSTITLHTTHPKLQQRTKPGVIPVQWRQKINATIYIGQLKLHKRLGVCSRNDWLLLIYSDWMVIIS